MPIEIRGLTPLIQVYDMPASIRFYTEALDFELVSTSPALPNGSFHWCLLRWGQAELMLNTAYEFDHDRPVPSDPVRTAAHDDTCLYFGCPDVDSVYDHLSNKGIQLKPPTIAPYGMKQLYLHDPDGYNLCFQWST